MVHLVLAADIYIDTMRLWLEIPLTAYILWQTKITGAMEEVADRPLLEEAAESAKTIPA